MITDRKVLTYGGIVRKLASHRKKKEKIVFVTGCFDVMHLGHVAFLNDAKKLGDVVVVGLGSDKTLRELKGKGRPVLHVKLRSRMLAALQLVDYVIVNDEDIVNYNIDFSILISKVRPDIFLVPTTDKKLSFKKELVEKHGGKLVTRFRRPPEHLGGGLSSTNILKKIMKL